MRRAWQLSVVAIFLFSGCSDKPELERRISELGTSFPAGRFANLEVKSTTTSATCTATGKVVETIGGFQPEIRNREKSVAQRADEIAKSLNNDCRLAHSLQIYQEQIRQDSR